MQLFYNPTIESDLFLEKEEHIHATKVLRKKEGDTLFVMNGKGGLFECLVTQIASKKTTVSISKHQQYNKDNHLHIAIAPTKNNNRMEWFLEKATEIGVAEITPLLCARSERKVIKKDRMEKIILAAAKQSKSYFLPQLHDMIPFKKFVESCEANNRFIAHCEEETEKKTLVNYSSEKGNTTIILIGPEGDFTSEEITSAKNNHFLELSLGESRLRTETAAVVAAVHYNMLP